MLTKRLRLSLKLISKKSSKEYIVPVKFTKLIWFLSEKQEARLSIFDWRFFYWL